MRGPDKNRTPRPAARGPAHPLAGRKLRTAVAKPVRDPSTPRERPLDGEGRPYLTLAQFVKRAKLVESGGEAKHRVRQGGIEVNGQAEVRPGRKLHQGDRVRIAGRELTVDLESTSELPE